MALCFFQQGVALDDNAKNVVSFWCHQFKFTTAGTGHDHVSTDLTAIDAHAGRMRFDAEPISIRPHAAGLAYRVAATLTENLQAVGLPLLQHAIKTSCCDLVVALFPIAQVMCMFVDIMGDNGAPPCLTGRD